MIRKPSHRRDEPKLFAESKQKGASSGLRGERLDVASEADDPRPGRAGRGGEGARPGAARERHVTALPAVEASGPAERSRGEAPRRPVRLAKVPPSGGGREPPPAGRPPAQRKRRRWLGRCLRWTLVLAIWGLVLLGAVIAYYAYDLPAVDANLAALARRPSITLLGADGGAFASYGDLYYDVVPLKEMPPYLPQAVLATEDRRFYHHFGVDPIGVLRALFQDLRTGQLRQGGSTITQQLAKNLFLTPERTIRRKVQEVLLALWLEHRFTKDQILTIYLNRVYLGAGTFGVEAAARKYFSKSARAVSLYEAAVLAGLLKAPSKFNPAANPDLTAARASQVLQNMVDAGFLAADRAVAAAQDRAALKPAAAAAWRGRYFADWAMDQVRDLLGTIDRDLVVTTTLDSRLQRLAEDTLAAELDKDAAKLDVSQGALVALAPDGAVRALVGGRDYRESQFNRATQAQRQPGSAFKPFIYLAALEAGYGPDSVFNDAPIAIGNWRPHNYEGKYYGRVTLRDALARSLNSVTAQLVEKVGVKHAIAAAHRLGIVSEIRQDASIALGTSEVNLLELTSAYGAFANDGKGVWPYGIREIRDRDGHVLYHRTGSGPGPVISPREAATMVDMMSGVLTYGTGKAAALGRPAAGKTGTTQDYRDAWFMGFTPDLIAGVWVGNDDDSPMKNVTGGRVPAQVWRRFMMAALKDVPGHEFARPPTILESVLQSLLGTGGGESSPAAASPGAPAPAVRAPGETVTLPGGQFKMNQ